MKHILEQTGRFLDERLDIGPRALMLLAAACLLATYFVPLWNLTMFAPQYPDGLRLDIYSYTLVGGNNGLDVREINLLNHYIGMRDLANENFQEFQWMPFVIGAMILFLLRAVVHGNAATLLDVVVLFTYFGAFSLWSFAYKMYKYGHELSPEAAVRVDPFMPPLFGYRKIANFEVYSYPQPGTYAMAAVMVLLTIAFIWTWRRFRSAPGEAAA